MYQKKKSKIIEAFSIVANMFIFDEANFLTSAFKC